MLWQVRQPTGVGFAIVAATVPVSSCSMKPSCVWQYEQDVVARSKFPPAKWVDAWYWSTLAFTSVDTSWHCTQLAVPDAPGSPGSPLSPLSPFSPCGPAGPTAPSTPSVPAGPSGPSQALRENARHASTNIPAIARSMAGSFITSPVKNGGIVGHGRLFGSVYSGVSYFTALKTNTFSVLLICTTSR